MTRTVPFYRALIPSWRGVILGAVIGAAIGGLLYKTVLSTTFAITVIQAGRIGATESSQVRVTPQLVIDRRGAPDVLIDRMQTPEFAKRVADAIGDQSVATSLPARQYGGNGALKVRPISDSTLVEIRVTLRDSAKALEVAGAAAKLALVDDTAMLSQLRKSYDDRLDALHRQLADAETISQTFEKTLQKITLDGGVPDNALAAAVTDSQTKVSSLSQDIWSIQTALAPPSSQESAIFAAPSLARPLLNSIWLALIAGALGGASIAYAIGLSLNYAKQEDA
ncbi:hypothetical protein A6U86_07630 [Rhizobium sp. AC27/96]|uniref:hypothetical protein n=1 Tax=Rhizobium sp. AC27/96 TaxID=1841653 RepID=UPI0008285A02|nr:hypothetical protein [Rhizobium sp. AC27/96]OCJ06955.1 hypothetical protein A6U86_07630 [Rhizobium sp. AC27/96]